MQPLKITESDSTSFKIPFIAPVNLAGILLAERSGFYLSLRTSEGLTSCSEVAPLDGVSKETLRRARHDLTEILPALKGLNITRQKDELIDLLRQEPQIKNLCASVRFAVESAVLMLAAKAAGQSLVEYLGGKLEDVQTAVLLQGTYQDVLADFKRFSKQGVKVYKLKVGDRNIALDVKKFCDMRMLLGPDSYFRLDANRKWGIREACIFSELVGHERIDFIEEPIDDIAQLDAFYQQTRMRVALDETLAVVQSGIRSPARCSSPLAGHEGVVAYVLKPMVLGFIATLDWIEEAKLLKRKAVISSVYESPAGFKVLANLACLSGQIAGLGTERWCKDISPMVSEGGLIKKESLI